MQDRTMFRLRDIAVAIRDIEELLASADFA